MKEVDWNEDVTKLDYKKKIKYLEEEILRKDDIIEVLKKENELLLQTAFKNAERKVDTKIKAKIEHKDRKT